MTRTFGLRIAAFGLVACLAAASTAEAVLINDPFTATNYDDYVNPAATRTSYKNAGTGTGVGGITGRANAPTVSGNSTTYGMIHDMVLPNFNTVDKFTVSQYFLTSGNQANSTGTILAAGVGLGTVGDGDDMFNTGFIGFETMLRRGTNTTGGAYKLRLRLDDTSTTESFSPGQLALATNNWYQLQMTVERTALTTYNVSAEVRNWGANGLTGGTVVLSHSNIYTGVAPPSGTALDPSSPLRAGLFNANNVISGNQGGSIAADNFSVVPEPSSFVLAGLGLLSLGLLRRRRK